MTPTLKAIVKDNKVMFAWYREGNMYYSVTVGDEVFAFPVPLSDVGNATLLAEDKAILFMRYIRKALDSGTFLHYHN